MKLQNSFNNAQTQTAANPGAHMRLIHLVIPFPDIRKLILFDTRTMIDYFDTNPSLFKQLLHDDLMILSAVVDGIVNQIIDNLIKLDYISLNYDLFSILKANIILILL